MGNLGYYKRATRPITVTYGSEMVDGSKLSAAYPVKDKAMIYSGEPMYVNNTSGSTDPSKGFTYTSNGLEYVKVGDSGVTTTAKTPVAWAFTDSNSFDVLGSGKLKGVPVEDKFEIATPFYDQTQVYNVGDHLYVVKGYLHLDTNGDSLISKNSTETGYTAITPIVVGMVTNQLPTATSSKQELAVVGTVTRGEIQLENNAPLTAIDGSIDINGSYVSTEGSKGLVTGGPRQWINDTGSKTVLMFETNWGKIDEVAANGQ